MPSCGRKNNEYDYDKDLLGEEMVGIDISRTASTFTIRDGGSQLRSQLTLDGRGSVISTSKWAHSPMHWSRSSMLWLAIALSSSE